MTAFKELLIGGYVLRFWPSDNGWVCGITESMMDALAQQVVPSQRTWVGLKDEEIDKAWRNVDYTVPYDQFRIDVAKAIEAKLKEKNT
jgi:hypothetical protein